MKPIPKIWIMMMCLVMLSCMEFVSVSASIDNIGTAKQNDCITLPQTCNCTFSNITTIMYPNKTYVTINKAMTQSGTYFNYTFCNTSSIGQYFVNGIGDKDGITQPFNYYFNITPNGRPDPSGGIVVLFVVIFLVLIGSVCFMSVYSIGHLMSLDFDLKDMAIDWGIFFIIGSYYFLESNYLSNLGIEKYLNIFLWTSGILLVLIPIIAFILSITVGSLNKKKINVQPPPKLRFR